MFLKFIPLSFFLFASLPASLSAAPSPAPKAIQSTGKTRDTVVRADTAQVHILTCLQDRWLPGTDSAQVCLAVRGKSRKDSLYLEYRVFAPGKNLGLLRFAYPPVDSNPTWKGSVDSCADEAACRLKFFTKDWIALTARTETGLSVDEFPSILNTKKIEIPGCDQACKNKVRAEAIDQVQKGRSRYVMLFTHPYQGHGPFIYVPSKEAFVWLGLNDLVDEHSP